MQMSRFFSAPPAVSRRPLTLWFVAAFLLFVPSCLGVLDIEEYEAVPEALCDLFDRCYGPEAFEGCRRHVSGQLEVADPQAREDYLEAFPDCLDNCASARGCLDQPILCRALHETCGGAVQCCGFAAEQVTCFDQSCCLRKGAACQQDADCCAGSCSGNGCTADPDPVCAQLGQTCNAGTDCCSGTCTAGVCANACLTTGVACSGGADCCSGTCTGGVCANSCVDVGVTCNVSADCCSGICTAGVCANMCADNGSVCINDSECCSGQCAAGLCRKNGCVASGALCLDDVDCCADACDQSRGICGNFGCFPDGTPCGADVSCCSGLCDPIDQRCSNRSCKKTSDACITDADCCGLSCQGSSCQCALAGIACTQAESYKCCSRLCENDLCADCRPVGTACTGNGECCSGACSAGLCCNFVGCSHSICAVGVALSTKDCSPQTVGAAEASCVDMICAQDPGCCCNMWDQSCVDKVATVCKLTCP